MTEEKKDQFDLEQISPYEQKMILLRQEAEQVDVTDIKKVHEVHQKLVKGRTSLVDAGEQLRSGANKFAAAVRERVKEILEVTADEEARLKAIKDEAKEAEEREERKALLPMRKNLLTALGLGEVEDDVLLGMNEKAFEAFKITKLEEKARQLTRDQEDKEREANKKKEAEEAEARARQKLLDEEKARNAEAERLEKEKLKNKNFKAFLKEHGYNSKTDIIEGDKLYRLVADFKG